MKSIGRYHRAEDVDHAVELAAELGDDATFIAGGQSLVNLMKARLTEEGLEVIDVNGLTELSFVEGESDVVRIGALATHAEVLESDLVADRIPALAAMVSQVADTQVRNMGTVGGSLAHADPASDYAVFATATDSTFAVASPDGTRTIPAREFFTGFFETALGTADLLTEIRVPIPDGDTAVGFEKFAKRTGDFPLVNAAAVLSGSDGICSSARVDVGCVSEAPVRSTAAVEYLEGTRIEDVDPGVAGARAAEEIEPMHDQRIGTDYQLDLVEAMVESAVEDCLDRLGERPT